MVSFLPAAELAILRIPARRGCDLTYSMSLKGYMSSKVPLDSRNNHIYQIAEHTISQHLLVEDLAERVLHTPWNALALQV